MATQFVSTQQRFRRYGEWCPICGGHSGMKQGRGERCAGFLSDDGEYVFCTRPEHAGDLEVNEKTTPPTYCHKLYGACDCGKEHNPARPSSNGHRKEKKEQREQSDFFSYDDPRVTGYFPYYDEQGNLLFVTVRYEWPDEGNSKGHSKTYRQFHHKSGKWVSGVANIRRVLYRFPDLLKADPSRTIYVVEGENKVEALRRLGLVATCNVGGALKFQKEYSTFFKGRRVVILPDNDEAGEKHAADVAKKLQGESSDVQIVKLPGLPEKGDIIDWLASGGTREQLEQLTSPLLPIEPGRRFSDIQEKEIEWFWEKWIPRGKITMIDAMPDQGKSVLCTTLAASASTGATMPDGALGVQGAVIMVNLEDDAADTVKPRLLAAGADVSKVIDLSLVRTRDENGEMVERPFQIPRDLPLLEEQIVKHGVVLVCLDPLMAILDSSLKSSNDQDVRQALTPLARLLERTRCACLIVRHFNKGSSDNAIIRGAGSMGIVGAARSQLFVTPDPDNPERHILALGKHNLSTGASNLIYRIVSDEICRPRIQWEGTSSHSTAELLSTAKPSVGRQEIRRILREADKPLGALEIVEHASHLTYEQARQLLSRMSKAGEIVSISRGLYTLSQPSQSSQLSQVSQPSQIQIKNTNFSDCDRCGNNCDSAEECHNQQSALEANSDDIVTNVTDVTPRVYKASSRLSNEQKEVIEALAQSEKPLGAKGIAVWLRLSGRHTSDGAIRYRLFDMKQKGLIKELERGKYTLSPNVPNIEEDTSQASSPNVRQDSETLGDVRDVSDVRDVRHVSGVDENVRQDSKTLGDVRHVSDVDENVRQDSETLGMLGDVRESQTRLNGHQKPNEMDNVRDGCHVSLADENVRQDSKTGTMLGDVRRNETPSPEQVHSP